MNEMDDKLMNKFRSYIADSEDKPDLAELMEDKSEILRIVNSIIVGNVRVYDMVEDEGELYFKVILKGYRTCAEVSCVDFFIHNDASLDGIEKSLMLLHHIEEIDFTLIAVNNSTYEHKITGEQVKVFEVKVKCNKCGKVYTYSYDEIMRICKCINCL